MKYFQIINNVWTECKFDHTKRQINLYNDDCKTIYGIGLYSDKRTPNIKEILSDSLLN
jgi:hypothetical protein